MNSNKFKVGRYNVQDMGDSFQVNERYTIFKDSGAIYWIEVPSYAKNDGDIPQGLFTLRDVLLSNKKKI